MSAISKLKRRYRAGASRFGKSECYFIMASLQLFMPLAGLNQRMATSVIFPENSKAARRSGRVEDGHVPGAAQDRHGQEHI
jgi:hypothetical protein